MKIRMLLAVIGCIFLARPVLADTRDDVVQGILRCAAIKDDRAWLNCTYGAQQPMRARLGLPPAPDYQQRLVPPSPYARAPAPAMAPAAAPVPPPPGNYTPPPGYVLQRADQVRPREATTMQILSGKAAPVAVSQITAVAREPDGAFIVTLANGEVWHQVGTSSPPARIRVGARATITPGMLWSHNLRTDDGPKSYKVEQRR
jgi:hypothetical protein